MIAFDVHKSVPIDTAFITLKKEGFQVLEEGLTDNDGAYTFRIKQQGQHEVSVKKAGFVEYSKKINFGKGFLQNVSEGGVY